VARTRGYLGGDSDNYTLLSGGIDNVTTALPLTYPAQGAGRGAIVELRDATTQEICYVWVSDAEDDLLTVQRGWAGTTAQSWSADTLVAVRPSVTDYEIVSAIKEEARSLNGEGLYKQASLALTYDNVEDGYDLAAITDMISPYAVETVRANRTSWVHDYKRDTDLLRLFSVDGQTVTATLHYRATFGTVTDKATDLVATVGIPQSAVDIVPLGAAIRILTNREAERTQVKAQTHARGNEDVPPGSNVRTLQMLSVSRANRLRVERQRLHEDWPMRIR
jgi:hypothetical protein